MNFTAVGMDIAKPCSFDRPRPGSGRSICKDEGRLCPRADFGVPISPVLRRQLGAVRCADWDGIDEHPLLLASCFLLLASCF